MDVRDLSHVLLWTVTAAHGVVTLALLRHIGTSLKPGGRRGAGSLAVLDGGSAPEVNVIDLQGARHRYPGPAWGAHITVFVSPQCAHCRLAVRVLSGVAERFGVAMVALVRGDSADALSIADDAGLEPARVFVDEEGSAFAAWGVDNVPVLVGIDREGVVLCSVEPGGTQAVERMVERFVRLQGPAPEADTSAVVFEQ